MTSGSTSRRAGTPDRGGGRRAWPGALTDTLFLALALFAFGGLSCYDDDDCHTHTVCCGGITIVRHCHSSGHHPHSHDGLDVSSQVAVLATDAPAERVRSLHVTITEITLESGEAHPQFLYRSETGYRVDLLSLRGTDETRLYELLAAPTLVHAATYDSIWISMRDPAIVLESGEVVGSTDIDLDGAVDVVFREPIPIGADEAAFIVLDFDLKRSLARMDSPDAEDDVEDDGEVRWRFRPLIFAKVIREEVSGALLTPTDLEGTIDEMNFDEDTLDIDLAGGRGSVTVRVHRDSVIVGPELARRDFDDLRLGETVRVRGDWRADGDLDARSIASGSTFRVSGRVERVERDGIVLSVASEDEARTTMRVAVTGNSILSFGRLEAAALQDIRPGRHITMTGYRSDGPGEARTAALVDLSRVGTAPLPLAAAPTKWPRIDGVVTRVDLENRTLILRSGHGDSEAEEEIEVPGGSEILFLERTDGVLWQTPMSLEQIRSGMDVEVEKITGDDKSPDLYLFHQRSVSRPARSR